MTRNNSKTHIMVNKNDLRIDDIHVRNHISTQIINQELFFVLNSNTITNLQCEINNILVNVKDYVE